MTILKILQYPDPKLKRVAQRVEAFNTEIQTVIADMFETHYAQESCAALAATQLDMPIPWRITVIDFSPEKDQPLCLVNPLITHSEGEHIEAEGCMSVCPNYVSAKVKRAARITVHAQDASGDSITMEADGFMAKCIQHEIDHLDGHIYLDRLSKLKRDGVERKIKKVKKLSS